ncbi:MAG: hypothetical protein ASARMPREDX12_008917 [Alectoria sarmentosa]|nr:MAG: hypothetical protein ASARMPREDX12_008917 [Alectoria sarmentosa]
MAGKIMPKLSIVLNPITALASLGLGTSEPYLLAGEGQFLKVFDDQRKHLIHPERIFESQAIHGIACKSTPQGARNSGILLIWGGRSICLVSIDVNTDVNGGPLIKFRRHMPEAIWDDWILDGRFRPIDVVDSGSGSNTVEAILVTAHNEILSLKVVTEMVETRGNHWLSRIASGPSSILYSAHTVWADSGQRLLIAAGTVFGEVLLWSFLSGKLATPRVYLHYNFRGHEGSVFGVRISEEANKGSVKRILASCSDDRTIRIWNISDRSSSEMRKQLTDGESSNREAGFLEDNKGAESTGFLATIMGHASRIWGLHFLIQNGGRWDLMSYGEDGTAQVWRVGPVLGGGKASPMPQYHSYRLSHQATYANHSGKNLWAMTVFPQARQDCIVATGGADGHITTYKPLLHDVSTHTDSWTGQYTMEEVSKALQTTHHESSLPQADKVDSSMEEIFNSLKGSWKLLRNLDSLLSTYPSGILEGTAIFTQRLPTDEGYDAEYLYSERGEFKTQQGLTMEATRQYVYRYSRTTDVISVWFVKPDDGSAVDYFFHKLDFRETGHGIGSGLESWSASGYHLCVEDNYNANYLFQLRDSKIAQWHAVFDVHGPKKDYVAKATYTRDQSEATEESEELIPLPSHSTIVKREYFNSKALHPKPDSFKTYVWISESEILNTTEQGHLFIGTLDSKVEANDKRDFTNVIWEHVGHQTGLKSSCIATSIPSLSIALLTGTDGTIYLYSHRSRDFDAICKLPGKAGFLKAHVLSEPWSLWLGSSHQREMVAVFATCLGSSKAIVFTLSSGMKVADHSMQDENGQPNIYEYHLTLPSKFIVTSSCFLDPGKCIILGSRSGDITIYDLAHTTPNLAVGIIPECFLNIHGEDTITLIRTVPHDVVKPIGKIAIITAGRDGKWAIHHVSHKFEKSRLFVGLETVHVGVPPFGPNIEGACIDLTSQDLLLWGFRSKQFVVWNESQKTEAMAVDCGGAHRNWAYAHHCDGSGGGSFVYTKASVCHVHSQVQASHQVIQQGGHGREIKAMALSLAIKTDDDVELRLVATGAEDTAIRIFDLNANLKCISILNRHTTGIQQLRWSSDGHLLFSAAGCEEFFVWRLQSAPLVTIGVVCEAQCPSVTEEVDLRIMDFATEEIHSHHDPGDVGCEPDYLLSMVYSDSSVRMFRYYTSTGKKSFKLLTEGSYTTYCLTQAAHLHIGGTLGVFCTASTDGHLALWPLPNAPSQRNDQGSPNRPPPFETQSHPLHWTTRTAIHQSSVKALDYVTISESESLIATGGDDGAIAFTRVEIRKPPELVFNTATLLLPNAHASAVTDVIFVPNSNPAYHYQGQNDQTFTLASVGNDQRLKIWEVGIDMEQEGVEGVAVRRVANVYTSVADASSLGTYCGGDARRWLMVAGIGVERWGVGE